MEPDARYTVVGVVVVILVAVAVGLLAWLRASGAGTHAQRYTVYFEHQTLEGLEPRGDVTMRGIKVGSIVAVRLSRDRPNVAVADIALAQGTPVRVDTRAVVDRNLMTGLASLALVGGGADSALLTRGPPGQPYPVIAEGESQVERVSQRLDELARHADIALQGAAAAFSPENRAAFADLLANLRAASRSAQGTLAHADAALGAFRHAADDAGKLAQRYDTLGAEATLTVRDARQALHDAGSSTQSLARHTDEAITTSASELSDAARAVRSAAESVGTAADRLRDPGQAIYGRAPEELGPGEGSP